MHILHIASVLHTAAYSLTYSAYSAYCNIQNMQTRNMNPARFFACFVVYCANYFAYSSILYDIFSISCILQDMQAQEFAWQCIHSGINHPTSGGMGRRPRDAIATALSSCGRGSIRGGFGTSGRFLLLLRAAAVRFRRESTRLDRRNT